MLFNSWEFLLIFLPATLAGFFGVGRYSRPWALRWLILASLGFYAWWRPVNVLIIAPSIAINYLLSRWLLRLVAEKREGTARAVLLAGITFNIAFLGYFKYINFLAEASNDFLGTHFVLAHVILPLGISFITFQKIAFLIDVHGGRVTRFTLQDYALFVLFFPQLIAGPIVHYREMMPQFHTATCRPDRTDLAVGLTLFVFGLFKKVVLADSIAPLVSGIYAHAGKGPGITLLPAWMAAIGFTLQIYFDFSGYSDMALGLARFVGVRFPANFNSPLKTTSIIDFWLRWHMTLTRFLTAYIYNPLTLWLTRRRLSKGLPAYGGKRTTLGAYAQLLVFPTILTMVISGVWHGAGYLFILWGLAHGLYLTVNHGWRVFGPAGRTDKVRYQRIMKPVGFVLTLVSVVTAMVLFRANTLHGAADLLRGMFGLNGIALPALITERLGGLADRLYALGLGQGMGVELNFPHLGLWIALLGFIALLCPNTLQLLNRYEPALGWKPGQEEYAIAGRRIAWQPNLLWAGFVSAIAICAVLHLGGVSEFLYWQF